MPPSIQIFPVSIQAVIARDVALLVVRERVGQLWELPGGRIDAGEELLPPRAVLQRELREELGPEFRCRIGAPVLTFAHAPRHAGRPPVFVLGLRCDQPEGEIALSDEHDAWRYVDAQSWRSLPMAPGYAAALAEWFAAC